MSDKKQPKQSKTDKTSADSSHPESQTGLTASIDMSSSQEALPNQPASVDSAEKPSEKPKNKPLDDAPDKTKLTADESISQKPSSNNTNEKSASPVKNTASNTSKKSTTVSSESSPEKSAASKNKKRKISKIAVVALIIALIAILASVGHYYWSEQQKAQYSLKLNDMVEDKLVANQQEIAQQLTRNSQNITQNITQLLSQSKQANASELNALRNKLEQGNRLEQRKQDTIAQLQQKIASLGQNQPSDWLLQEAEYLIRVASRSLWLEKEPGTAISLLKDADLRIQELNDPQFLALRQTIQQDIAKLQLLPKLATDDVILKLMVLDQQIKQLPLALFEIPEISQSETTLELTDNATDWRENLAKTWRKFTDEFFTVTRRTGNIEPLMSPQFQQNLRENLSLKLQTAIWAASKSKGNIYQQSLNDIQRWIGEYFDMTKLENKIFLDTIDSLKTATITASYPNKLASLQAIRQLLSDQETSISTLENNNNTASPQASKDEPASAELSEDL